MGNYVSLLPLGYAQKSKRAEAMRKAAFATIMAAAVLFAAVVVSVAYRTAGQLEIASVESETEQVELQIIQLSEIEIKQNELLELRNMIVSVQSQDPMLPSVLAGIIGSLPPGVRINSLSLSINKDGVLIGSTDCTGSTYEDISRFMNELKKNSQVAVECKSSRDNEGSVDFSLELTFASQSEEQAVEE